VIGLPVYYHFKPTEKDELLTQKYDLYDQKVLLYVGRMSGNKRIEDLIKMLNIVKKTEPKTKLLLVGDNINYPYCETAKKCLDIAKMYGIEKDVIFTGPFSDHDELTKFYNIADVFVTASLHEGFCLPLIEAMACGTPVVGANNTAIPQTMGKAGLLFEPKNPKDMANKVLKILTNKKLRNDLIKKGLKRRKKFTLQKFNNDIRKIMREVGVL
jgi:glycosyltransferase involved in cell wall biosynthesis